MAAGHPGPHRAVGWQQPPLTATRPPDRTIQLCWVFRIFGIPQRESSLLSGAGSEVDARIVQVHTYTSIHRASLHILSYMHDAFRRSCHARTWLLTVADSSFECLVSAPKCEQHGSCRSTIAVVSLWVAPHVTASQMKQQMRGCCSVV